MTITTNIKNKSISTKITVRENKEINEIIEAGMFLNSSDFVREAIRDKLKSIKVIKERDIDYDTAKKEILGYYKNYDEAYISEVSEDLKLDLNLVIKVTEELKKEGRLKQQ
jgi:Arc/MetJ-type ribon-helix-helix transcriptional regulator